MSKKTAAVEPKVLEQQSTSLQTSVQALKIVSDNDLRTAAAYLKDVDGLIKQVHDSQDPICDATHKAWKTATAERKRLLDPLESLRGKIRQLTADYTYQQEQQRLQLLREAEAKAAAEAERIRQQEIAAAKKAKDAEAVKALKAAPLPIVPVASVPEAPKVEGIRTIIEYDYELVNAALIPREYLCVDATKIRAVVRALKKETNIPGIRIVERHRTDASR